MYIYVRAIYDFNKEITKFRDIPIKFTHKITNNNSIN